MITVSRKEIEALQRWQDDKEIANNCYEDDDGYFILYDDLRALLDKAEVVSGEAVGEIKIYWGSDTGYEYGLTLIGGALGSQKEYNEWIVKNFNGEGVFKLYTTPQPSRIAELEIARLKAIIEDMKVIDNVFGKGELPYGSCPVCHGAGLSRERRPNGNDKCVNGHVYPSREAMKATNDK